MGANKEKCWCCSVELETLKKDGIRPAICVDCLNDKHLNTESDSDMFIATVDCPECKLIKSLQVRRSGAQKLFENRDLLKCKGCEKVPIKLRLWKTYEQPESVSGPKLEPILAAKEWRDKDPDNLVEWAS